MSALRAYARALDGNVVGRDEILAPGPGHSRNDRSLSVKFVADQIVVHSFAGDDWRDCRDYVRGRLGLSAHGGNRTFSRAPTPVKAVTHEVRHDQDKRRMRAAEIWDEATEVRGSLAEQYLASRGLRLTPDIEALRFHKACPWREDDGTFLRVTAMVAAFRDIHTDHLVGIHRTRLNDRGEKIDRKMLGNAKGAAIKIDPDAHVTVGLTIGEGVETCIAARQIGFKPTWALGSAGAIESFPVLAGIEALTILRETDDSGANFAACDACGRRWCAEGREVLFCTTTFPGDLNDALKRMAA